MKLIDKDTLIVEIERLERSRWSNKDYDDGYHSALFNISSFTNAIEGKEVDLEKEIEYNYNPMDGLSFEEFERIAKHFFKLGLQAQKGEY